MVDPEISNDPPEEFKWIGVWLRVARNEVYNENGAGRLPMPGRWSGKELLAKQSEWLEQRRAHELQYQNFSLFSPLLRNWIATNMPTMDLAPFDKVHQAVVAWESDGNSAGIGERLRLEGEFKKAQALLRVVQDEAERMAAKDGGADGKARKVTRAKRAGRLRKDDSKAKKMALLATIREHGTLKFDYPALALQVGVSEATARRWVEAEDEKYKESKAANPK